MTNWNYEVEERNGIDVLINQNTKNADYKVENIDLDKGYLNVSDAYRSDGKTRFSFNRIDNINDFLKINHPELLI